MFVSKQDVGGVVKVLEIVVKVLEDVRITVVLPLLNVVNVVVNVLVNVEVAWVVVILVHWIVRVDCTHILLCSSTSNVQYKDWVPYYL